MHFGMRLAGPNVPAFADHPPIAHQYTAHARIRIRRIQA
jgi:hypothetical protein